MKFELIRSYLPDRTVGKLDKFVTLERPWRSNQRNISCIPEGVYNVTRDKFGRHQFYRFESVTGRSDIEVHGGVYPTHSDGCVLVGESFDSSYNLRGSDSALKELLKLVGDNSFTLTIRQYNPNTDEELM